ncbi:DUF3050 domain-containing protein [Mongoliibacter sp.]|uniref:DUF3050 domain-containing protein n=1 Tax=Mongoliibacter sp. TaxID=2022438 RepID=UPI0025E5D691|nr:DUF3050 domain-containing protein [Mongoliibacter sp.]
MHIEKLMEAIQPYRNQLLAHPIYKDMDSLEDFQVFMEQHVFAVWDFMSLLKALQLRLTGMSLPWRPSGDPQVTRLINDIVMAEESDEDGNGSYCSHFELYLRAMQEAGASTYFIDRLLELLNEGVGFDEALESIDIPTATKAFLKTNFHTVLYGKPHEIAASFTLGREDLIPDLFRKLVNDLIASKPEELKTLEFYFERHIHLDEDHHGPLAMRMLEHLCGQDAVKWKETENAAIEALKARKILWDGIHDSIMVEV